MGGSRPRRQPKQIPDRSLNMGCFLIYTDEDLGKTEVMTSLDEAYERLAEEPKGFIEALSDENHANHRLAMSAALRGVSADLPTRYKHAFIESVKNICRVQPTVVGLVHNYSYRAPQRIDGRNQGQTAILDTKIKAWRAAEVISAEAIRQRGSAAGNAQGGVGVLSFNVGTDRLDFQQKFQAHSEQLKSTSIEADFLIHRTIREGVFEEQVAIGVDVKHSQSGCYTDTRRLPSQLDRVVSALSEGSLEEFHFATAGTFSNTFKSLVDEANAALLAGEDGCVIGGDGPKGRPPKIFWHEGVWLDGYK